MPRTGRAPRLNIRTPTELESLDHFILATVGRRGALYVYHYASTRSVHRKQDLYQIVAYPRQIGISFDIWSTLESVVTCPSDIESSKIVKGEEERRVARENKGRMEGDD